VKNDIRNYLKQLRINFVCASVSRVIVCTRNGQHIFNK